MNVILLDRLRETDGTKTTTRTERNAWPAPVVGELYLRIEHVGRGPVPWDEARALLTAETADVSWWRGRVPAPAYVYASRIPYGSPDVDGVERFALLGVLHRDGVELVEVKPPETATVEALGVPLVATLGDDGRYHAEDVAALTAWLSGVVRAVRSASTETKGRHHA